MPRRLIINCDTQEKVEVDAPAGSEPVPQSITPRQAKLALLGAGLLDNVEAMIAAADRATQISWNEAIEFRRDDPLLNGMAAQLQPPLTAEQIDDLFRTGAAIQ